MRLLTFLITTLYALAENCKYRKLHDESIRDHIVAGLRDTCLAERMQLDKDLMLEKAGNIARQSEVIKRQQALEEEVGWTLMQ